MVAQPCTNESMADPRPAERAWAGLSDLRVSLAIVTRQLPHRVALGRDGHWGSRGLPLTIEFAAFFVVVLLASWLLMPMPKYWKPFIFFASLAFYAAADWRWVFLLVASIVGNQAAATVISKMARDRGEKQCSSPRSWETLRCLACSSTSDSSSKVSTAW